MRGTQFGAYTGERDGQQEVEAEEEDCDPVCQSDLPGEVGQGQRSDPQTDKRRTILSGQGCLLTPALSRNIAPLKRPLPGGAKLPAQGPHDGQAPGDPGPARLLLEVGEAGAARPIPSRGRTEYLEQLAGHKEEPTGEG